MSRKDLMRSLITSKTTLSLTTSIKRLLTILVKGKLLDQSSSLIYTSISCIKREHLLSATFQSAAETTARKLIL